MQFETGSWEFFKKFATLGSLIDQVFTRCDCNTNDYIINIYYKVAVTYDLMYSVTLVLDRCCYCTCSAMHDDVSDEQHGCYETTNLKRNTTRFVKSDMT